MTASFRDKLLSQQPVVSLELSPPKGTDTTVLIQQAQKMRGYVDAINIPDCQLSILKMSSLASSKIIQDETGIEAIWQLTCRDRNMIALQADILGAYALGIQNILVLTGDPVQLGDQRDVAKQVYHLDSVRLLDLVSQLNAGQDATGKALKKGGTHLTVGSALNPFKLTNRAQQLRLQQKIERGVDFFQTQPVYELAPVYEMLEAVELAAQTVGKPAPRIMVGIIPPKSADAARYMNKTVVGVSIPNELVELLDKANDPVKESVKYCTDLILSIQPVCSGIHLMPIGMVSKVSPLLETCFVPSVAS